MTGFWRPDSRRPRPQRGAPGRPRSDTTARRGLISGWPPPRTLDTSLPETASKAIAISRADCMRSSGFFSRQRRTIRSSPCGTELPLVESSGTSSFRIAVIVSAAVSRRNARRPVSISKRTAPSAKMSVRVVDSRPREPAPATYSRPCRGSCRARYRRRSSANPAKPCRARLPDRSRGS